MESQTPASSPKDAGEGPAAGFVSPGPLVSPGPPASPDPIVVSPDPVVVSPAPVVPPGTAGPSLPGPALGPSRAGRAWARILPALLVLGLVLLFVFQNLHDVRVSYFTASGRFPLAVALLAAAAGGALVVLAIGSVRILQLRRVVRRQGRAAGRPAGGAVPGRPVRRRG